MYDDGDKESGVAHIPSSPEEADGIEDERRQAAAPAPAPAADEGIRARTKIEALYKGKKFGWASSTDTTRSGDLRRYDDDGEVEKGVKQENIAGAWRPELEVGAMIEANTREGHYPGKIRRAQAHGGHDYGEAGVGRRCNPMAHGLAGASSRGAPSCDPGLTVRRPDAIALLCPHDVSCSTGSYLPLPAPRWLAAVCAALELSSSLRVESHPRHPPRR